MCSVVNLTVLFVLQSRVAMTQCAAQVNAILRTAVSHSAVYDSAQDHVMPHLLVSDLVNDVIQTRDARDVTNARFDDAIKSVCAPRLVSIKQGNRFVVALALPVSCIFLARFDKVVLCRNED